MIQVADNFNYRGKKPNFDRDSFDTLQDMKNYSENSLDDGHISYCKETNKHYKFNSNNQSDPTTGKWVEQHEAVPADEEDITEQNGTIQLANKTYDKQSFSGLGRVYLRKNIVGDKNVLTQAMINKANTIYVIQYDYDLKEASINIPENCVLQFDGGSLSNGTIVGNNTKIKTELEKIFNNITIDGNWNVVEAHPEWFGALPDGIYDCTDAIQKTINSFDVTKLNNGVYFINSTIQYLPDDFVKNNIHSDNVSKGERMYVTVNSGKTVSFDLDVTTFITQYTVVHQYLTFMINPSLAIVDTPLYEVGKYKLIITINDVDYILKSDIFQNGLVSIESIKYLYDIIPDPKDSQCKLRYELTNTSDSAVNIAIDYPIIEIYKNNTGYGSSYKTNIIPTDLSKDFCKDNKGIYGKVGNNTYDINLGIIRFNNAASDSSESYEYIKITKIPTSGFTFLYSTYNVLSKYSLLYLDNKLYILSDVYDTGNDSFLNIKYLFDSISYTLDIYIKVPTKYGKLIVRDTKWANLNTYQWYSKNTDPYPSEAVDAEFISSNVLTLPNTLIGTKTYDKFGNELTWSKSDWLNPDGSLVTKVIFASKLNDFTKNNTIYNIVRYIDLKGETLTIPENSVLNFIGGAIGNGTIIGNKTKVINLNVDRIILSGTWFDSGITSNRPTNVLVGFQYFDTTVNKPIFWDGSKWIDATGATV